MRADAAVALLRSAGIFQGLDPDLLARVAERALERRYKRGQLIFSEGDLGDSLFVIAEGLIKVLVTSEAGDELTLTTLRSPEVFGELALIDGGPRSATAEVVEPTRVLMLGRTSLLEAMHHDAKVQDAVLRSLGAIIRRLTEQTADLVFLDLQGRVAKLLLGLAEREAPSGSGPVSLDLRLTQSDLATMVGGSRQSVNQILQGFERHGYLRLEGRKVVLERLDPLRRRARP